MSSHIVEIAIIDELVKHPNADRLEIATVKGWSCIVQIGQFQKGEKVVYIPIDSILPEELAEKLGVTSYLKNGERLRTVRLRGYISQGLLMKIDQKRKVGEDVAKEFKITKWAPPPPKYQGNGKPSTPRNPNPNFDKYTNLENIKNYTNVFQPEDEIVITEKVHGTNFRAGKVPSYPITLWDRIKRFIRTKILHKSDYVFVVGSHNVQLEPDSETFYKDNTYGKAARMYKLNYILPDGYTLYGEIYGEGIQDLQYGMEGKGIDVVFFDLKVDGKYVDYPVFRDFCAEHNLPYAKNFYTGPYGDGSIVALHTDGDSYLAEQNGAEQIGEGVVVKLLREQNDPRIGRKILKSISNDYLLRKNGTEYQ
ncbi:RNA ligase (ATP) (plasmid) [Paenibacillus peoriae]|uniref:RNA ligase (ATP) n=1 Tax=Paenibacillus peoriae TaxID=59893 RepID=A0A7H0YGZ8_9BACL|nr:RNA ligase (ATP) [Paenibacillus peoriae]QNR70356.1 RNA ligase (ATP) [Paenibacillus peoriae]